MRPIAHRGPDDEGIWTDEAAGIGLGHRRLAIVDLSPAGHEPMHSADGRFVITFNGEIYNHAELRKALEEQGAVPNGGWRGHSDVEMFLEGIAAWGLTETLRRSAGMFAFGLWDRKERTLSLVRDRFGEKPLYYGWAGKDFLFGSELKAIRAHPRFDSPIDRRALKLFAARTYIPAPLSIYERRVQAAAGLRADGRPPRRRRPGPIRRRRARPTTGSASPATGRTATWSGAGSTTRSRDEAEALGELEEALARAIGGQSMADVPVGAFLSGGIDSSTIVGALPEIFVDPGAHLLDRVRGGRVQRGRPRQGGRRASRHRPPRAHRDRARDARRDSAAARRCTTSRSPTARRSRPTWSAASPASRSRSR